jgi:hypothetical protein
MAPLQPSLQHEPPPQAAGASYYASCAVASAAAPAAAAAAAAIISRRIPLRIMARGFSGPTVVMFAPPTPPGRRRMRPFSAGVSAQSVSQAAAARTAAHVPQWIAKQQLARHGTKCFWREPVGQQKSAQRHEAQMRLKTESRLAPRTID